MAEPCEIVVPVVVDVAYQTHGGHGMHGSIENGYNASDSDAVRMAVLRAAVHSIRSELRQARLSNVARALKVREFLVTLANDAPPLGAEIDEEIAFLDEIL